MTLIRTEDKNRIQYSIFFCKWFLNQSYKLQDHKELLGKVFSNVWYWLFPSALSRRMADAENFPSESFCRSSKLGRPSSLLVSSSALGHQHFSSYHAISQRHSNDFPLSNTRCVAWPAPLAPVPLKMAWSLGACSSKSSCHVFCREGGMNRHVSDVLMIFGDVVQ